MRAFRFDLLGDKRNGSIIVVAPDRDSARRKATSAVSKIDENLHILDVRHESIRLPNDEATVAFVDTGNDE